MEYITDIVRGQIWFGRDSTCGLGKVIIYFQQDYICSVIKGPGQEHTMKNTIWALNFMYSMERFATAVYKVQKDAFHNKEVTEKMAFAVANEGQHVNILKTRLIEMKKTPFPLAFLFQFAGKIVGLISRCCGNILALKAGIVIEKRAVKDYGYFLGRLKLDDSTKTSIRKIITDEELHIRNWQDSIVILKKAKSVKD